MTDERGDAGAGTFGSYRLSDLVGCGRTGEVRRAFDTVRGRTVALKRMSAQWAEDPQLRERFWRDTGLAARLASEHAISIHDFGEIDGVLYVDMRLSRGVDLMDALAVSPGGLSAGRAVDITEQLAAALDAAHRVGLVHRGVEPSSVLLEPTTTGDLVSLVGFGLAPPVDAATVAATARPSGVADYTAPELFDDPAIASPASDVYALGCVLVAMLTGRPPFQGDPSAVMHQHLHDPAPLLSSLRPDLAPFDDVVETALAKAPDRRHDSAGALAAAARRASWSRASPVPGGVHAPVGAGPPPPTLVDTSAGRRGPRVAPGVLIGAGGLVLVLLVVLGVVLLRPSSSPAPPVDAAPRGFHLPVGAATSGDVVVSRDGRSAYALRADRAGALTMIDTATGTVRASVPVGPFPQAVDVSPDGSRVYVANDGENGAPGSTVSVVDTVAARVVGTVTVGLFPIGLAISPDGARVYVTNSMTTRDPTGTVSVIDTANDTVLATVPVGAGPTNPAVSPDSRLVFVPNTGSNPGTVSIIDAATDTVVRTLQVGGSTARSVAVSPDDRTVYVACPGPDQPHPGAPPPGPEDIVEVVDLASGTSTPLTTTGLDRPHDVKLSPDGSTLLVSDNGEHSGSGDAANSYLLVDARTGRLRRALILGGAPKESAVTQDGRLAYVAVTNPGDVWQVPLT